jgi:hypothetical protein
MVGFGGHILIGPNSKSFSKSRGNLHQLTTFTHAHKVRYFPQVVVEGNLKQLVCSSAKYHEDMSE